jgi:hypothetical protein
MEKTTRQILVILKIGGDELSDFARLCNHCLLW